MAQDYGDDMGEMLFRALDRAFNHATYRYNDKQMKEWYKDKNEKEGMTSEEAALEAEAMASSEQVCLPFGSANDAAYFAQLCRENGTYAAALSDKEGNGYIQFSVDELSKVQNCVPQFSEVMTRLQEKEIADKLSTAKPVTAEKFAELTTISPLPDLSANVHQKSSPEKTAGAGREARADEPAINHTARIRDEVATARGQCRDFSDFQHILAAKGIGIAKTQSGEVMFYEARTGDDGKLLPFGNDAQGRRDWAVGADTLKQKWGIDATNDWFLKNIPRATPVKQPQEAEQEVSDGSLDADGATPDLNQGIESHDGMDTDATTMRLERELNGTDIAPSKVREAEKSARSQDEGRGYSLSSEARDARAASKQLEKESGIAEREIDISDKLSPVR